MRSSTKTVIALHGFLGEARDWSLIENLLPADWQLHAVDLWSNVASFDDWSRDVCAKIEESTSAGPRVLMGYSLGGRLALHALLQKPELFSGAVIVSAHPGLRTEDERQRRVQADEIWAQRIETEPWSQLMTDWNAQPALATAHPLTRSESDFDRQTLAQAMRLWSLGQQRDLRTAVNQLRLPIEFVTGRHDAKFTELSREWMNEPAAGKRDHSVIENAGHRVPWDAPVQFRAILANFLSRW